MSYNPNPKTLTLRVGGEQNYRQQDLQCTFEMAWVTTMGKIRSGRIDTFLPRDNDKKHKNKKMRPFISGRRRFLACDSERER